MAVIWRWGEVTILFFFCNNALVTISSSGINHESIGSILFKSPSILLDMIVYFFLQILPCSHSPQQVKCCIWVLYISRLFSIHALTITKLLKMMTMMGKVLKRRWNKATIQLREETKARARAIRAPWHNGTMAPMHHGTMALQYCRNQGIAMATTWSLECWHHGTMGILGSRTEQQHSRSLKSEWENPPNTSRVCNQKLANGDFQVHNQSSSHGQVVYLTIADNKQFWPRYSAT